MEPQKVGDVEVTEEKAKGVCTDCNKLVWSSLKPGFFDQCKCANRKGIREQKTRYTSKKEEPPVQKFPGKGTAGSPCFCHVPMVVKYERWVVRRMYEGNERPVREETLYS